MDGSRFDEVRARIDEFLRSWPAAEFGPAHIILSDLNLEDYWFPSIRIELATQGNAEALATLTLLDWIQAVPEDDRCPVDGETDDDDEGDDTTPPGATGTLFFGGLAIPVTGVEITFTGEHLPDDQEPPAIPTARVHDLEIESLDTFKPLIDGTSEPTGRYRKGEGWTDVGPGRN